MEVKHARAWTSSAGFYTIQLKNFDDDDRYVRADAMGDGEMYFETNIFNQDKKEKLKLATYGKGSDELKIGPSLNYKGGMIGFAGADVGGVEVVHVDDEKICGTIDLDDKYLKVKGTFVAKIQKN